MTTSKTAPKGLGRGLQALFGDPAPEIAEAQGAKPQGARPVPVDLLSPNPFQPRRTFTEADLSDLTQSVREMGVLQPIVVRADPAKPGRFQIIAGERRWRASQAAGLHEVPVVVKALTDAEALEIAIVENVQRADLNAIEEALGFQALIDRFRYTQDKLAQRLAKSRSHIANTLRLLTLPESVRGLVESGALSAGHARALVTAKNPLALAHEAIAKGLSVREIEALAREQGGPKKPGGRPASRPAKDADTRRLEADLSAATGCKAEIDSGPNESGALTLRFASLDKLDELVARLMRVG